METVINVLDLIRTKILKVKRLDDVQLLMAKAYRGVVYVDAHHDEPQSEQATKEFTCRGQHYAH